MIRPATAADLDALVSLWGALMANGAEADPRLRVGPDARAWIRGWARDQWLRHEPFPHAWIAERGGAAVGFVTAWPEANSPALAAERVVRIGDLFVEAGHRRDGLGRALVDAALGAAAAAGYVDAVVGTLSRDARAVAFWEAMGFGSFRVLLRRDP